MTKALMRMASVHDVDADTAGDRGSSGIEPMVAPAFSRSSSPGEPTLLSDRLESALKRRLRPWSMGSALTVKDVCRAIDVSEDALLNWINARARPNFDKAGELIQFFASLEKSPLLFAELFGADLGPDVIVMSRKKLAGIAAAAVTEALSA